MATLKGTNGIAWHGDNGEGRDGGSGEGRGTRADSEREVWAAGRGRGGAGVGREDVRRQLRTPARCSEIG